MILLFEASVTHGQQWSKSIKLENSRIKQFVSFKLQALLSTVMKSMPSLSVMPKM